MFATITPPELSAALAAANPPTVLDVREPAEVAIAAIAGSVRIPLGEILATPPDLGAETDLVVHCKMQPRAEAAAAALLAAGHRRVRVLEGGMLAWIEQVEPDKTRY